MFAFGTFFAQPGSDSLQVFDTRTSYSAPVPIFDSFWTFQDSGKCKECLGLSRSSSSDDGPGPRPATFITDNMLAGSIVMLIGCLFLIGYKQIALRTGIVPRTAFSGSTSGAQQILSILGSLLLVFGFGCFIFF